MTPASTAAREPALQAPPRLAEEGPLRIVYGVSGEGSGHAMRAQVVLGALTAAGHEVRVVTYDRGVAVLGQRWNVFETAGLALGATDNALSVVRTVQENLPRLAGGAQRLLQLRRTLFEDFNPHCVITDFEPTTAHLAGMYDLPLLSLDNQHLIRYAIYPCPRRLKADALLTEAVIRALVPRPDAAVVTTFYFGEVKNERTFLVPPIVRPEIVQLQPGDGEHVLVYLTHGFESFLELLAGFPRERFVLYGAAPPRRLPNVEQRTFSPAGFAGDLAAARGIIATAGFSLISEALHLRVPYLALPMRNQFEQELNALLLETLGYGRACRRPDRAAVGEFLYRLPELREQLETAPRAGNATVVELVSQLLAGNGAALRTLRHTRRRDA